MNRYCIAFLVKAVSLLIIIVQCFSPPRAIAQDIGVITTNQSIIFKTRFFEYEVGFNGVNKVFRDIWTNKDYFRLTSESSFMQIKYNNSLYLPEDK